jgi:Mrp family chromosome partitioning ATPase
MGNFLKDQQKKDERIQKIEDTLKRVRHKVLVMSGKGGVGKSTVAVNLAQILANRGNKVGLMDVDLHGPSIAVLVNIVGMKPDHGPDGIIPLKVSENFGVISMANFMPNNDDALIWRGPMKITAIRQFLADVDWGDLDYLIIDAPPGTGDEPLTVAQEVNEVKAIVVTTPQEVALADVRKSINFCKNVDMPIIGVIENMSGYVCADCGHTDELFGQGGGKRTAIDMDVPFLGAIPFDRGVVTASDKGVPFMTKTADAPAANAYTQIADQLEKSLG